MYNVFDKCQAINQLQFSKLADFFGVVVVVGGDRGLKDLELRNNKLMWLYGCRVY